MSIDYKHLNVFDRLQIATLRGQGLSIRAVAEILGRSPSTLSRELRRNAAWTAEPEKAPYAAQTEATARWRIRHCRGRLKSPRLRTYVRGRLRAGWSPEQIAGRLGRHALGRRLSHQAIYNWVYREAVDLIPYLPRGRPRKRRHLYRRKHKYSIPERVSVRNRPAAVLDREQVGHWEVDAAVSRGGRAALLVMVERKTRYVRLQRLRILNAEQVRTALVDRLADLPRELRRTLTYDNGSENASHQKTNRALGTRSYFCEPYHSWEKGTVENTIGVLRRIFPKGTDFARVSDQEVTRAQRALNTRPRKCLDYLTPAEALRLECCTCS